MYALDIIAAALLAITVLLVVTFFVIVIRKHIMSKGAGLHNIILIIHILWPFMFQRREQVIKRMSE